MLHRVKINDHWALPGTLADKNRGINYARNCYCNSKTLCKYNFHFRTSDIHFFVLKFQMSMEQYISDLYILLSLNSLYNKSSGPWEGITYPKNDSKLLNWLNWSDWGKSWIFQNVLYIPLFQKLTKLQSWSLLYLGIEPKSPNNHLSPNVRWI